MASMSAGTVPKFVGPEFVVASADLIVPPAQLVSE